MRLQKWTVGLAAAGLVSVPYWAGAEEQPSPILTALSSTTISGYVNVSAHWNPGTGNANAPAYSFNAGKQDGFNLDVAKLTIERPLDEGQWSAGYKADLWFGPDANLFNTLSSTGTGLSDFGVRQAYVALRAPVGNGLDLKLGVWDTIIGYESHDAGSNPNYSRSYGYTVEPTTHTGLLATYQLLDSIGLSAGIANTMGPRINVRSPRAESHKTYMASVAFTVPDDAGFLAGSTVYVGAIDGFGGDPGEDQVNFYTGATLNTPVAGVKVGGAFDYVENLPGGSLARTFALYGSFQATEKLSVHARGEYANASAPIFGLAEDVLAFTGTLQYDLWRNVLSRLELRWDHDADGNESFAGDVAGIGDRKNFYTVVANLIYKF